MDYTARLTHDRVRNNTSDEANARIDRQTLENIRNYADQDGFAIRRRLKRLDKEWDTERALQLTSGFNVLLGMTLGLTVNKKWLILSAVSATFLMQHALQGWCPPLPVFRSLGVRTQQEIEVERKALEEMNEE